MSERLRRGCQTRRPTPVVTGRTFLRLTNSRVLGPTRPRKPSGGLSPCTYTTARPFAPLPLPFLTSPPSQTLLAAAASLPVLLPHRFFFSFLLPEWRRRVINVPARRITNRPQRSHAGAANYSVGRRVTGGCGMYVVICSFGSPAQAPWTSRASQLLQSNKSSQLSSSQWTPAEQKQAEHAQPWACLLSHTFCTMNEPARSKKPSLVGIH